VTARCPTCRKPASVATDNPYRPFCSERCKLADLGRWLNEDYRLPAADTRDELPTLPDE
jgi:endogenous inhibitor of DNA gyrase (YacG/DUF329 family)